ncbi:hypothetical protein AAFC00_006048 [Neodothiora populina]|uniref:Mitochondrial genome maintenance protein MGM101 n=1 Tax=Neodothiora populina TaxID=2781224 RepID=A0ABR3P843_9PEZI
MRASIALELAGELSSVLRASRPALTHARVSQIPRAATPATNCYRAFSTGVQRQDNGFKTNVSSKPQPTRLPRAPYTTTAKTANNACTPTSATTNTTAKPSTSSTTDASPETIQTESLTSGLKDPPPILSEDEKQVDWSRSFHGMSSSPFSAEQAAILTAELSYDDIEIKPDGIVYLPEIKYRRILNKAFGPGGWGLAPRGETIVTAKLVTREYGLVAGGRLVSIARGEQSYFDPDGIPTATEGCKSNALMRCCKDLGIASELWDPRFIRKFLKEAGRETMVEHAVTKKRRKHWMRKDDELKWPLKEVSALGNAGGNAASSTSSYRKV